jgi:hypothetical protein
MNNINKDGRAALDVSDLFESKREALFNELRGKAITRLTVRFSGGGDSGNIDESEIEGLFEGDVKYGSMLLMEPFTTQRNNGIVQKDGRWGTVHAYQTYTKLQELSDHVTNDVLDMSGIDWYNNDGGQGKVTYIVGKTPDEDRIEADIGQNYTQTEEHTFIA